MRHSESCAFTLCTLTLKERWNPVTSAILFCTILLCFDLGGRFGICGGSGFWGDVKTALSPKQGSVSEREASDHTALAGRLYTGALWTSKPITAALQPALAANQRNWVHMCQPQTLELSLIYKVLTNIMERNMNNTSALRILTSWPIFVSRSIALKKKQNAIPEHNALINAIYTNQPGRLKREETNYHKSTLFKSNKPVDKPSCFPVIKAITATGRLTLAVH